MHFIITLKRINASFYVYLMFVIIVDNKHSIYILNVDHYLKVERENGMLAHPHGTYPLLLRQIYYVCVLVDFCSKFIIVYYL